MAQIFRKEPATPTAQERPKPRPAAAAGGGDNTRAGGIARLRGNINDVMSELRKVTWPTPDETRNLTIVVIGISAALGLFLGGLDLILSELYKIINPPNIP